ncbi:sigma factor G inhibitor Gin [Bacillus fonticola]|uniref:sigma factor G inhibitor Gin n=1 Tax=Bacillus fonticola TaxID=2728853 RepID=UPI001474EDEF|nr:sigma factor G inhibitor Gin [Bacillus fonticola]
MVQRRVPVGKDVCSICEEEKQVGFYLYTSFICAGCEQMVVNTEPEDPMYQHYVKQLKEAMMPRTYS